MVLAKELVDVFAHLNKTNVATMVISIVSIIIIFCVKLFINERFKEKLIAPVPIDLIVVILTFVRFFRTWNQFDEHCFNKVIFGTLFSYLFQFKEKWHVVVIGEIPIG